MILFERLVVKKAFFSLILIFGLAAVVSAQQRDSGRNQRVLPPAETVTASGNLVVAHGMPAIRSGDTTYLVFGLNRLVGFVDGLREGAFVTIEGTARTSRNDNSLKFLMPSKLDLGGRNYELARPQEFYRMWSQIPQRDSQRQQAPHRFHHNHPRGRTPHGRTL